SAPRPHSLAGGRLLAWIAPLCILACTLIACTTTTPTGTERANAPTATEPLASVTPATAPTSPASTAITPTASTAANGLVVTVLATDVGLWQGPDTLSGNVAVSFTVNGN